METLVITSPLKKIAEEHGIIVFQNEELRAQYFALDNNPEELISCSDGVRAFYEIELHGSAVVCKIFPHSSEDESENLCRIFLKGTSNWLINPFSETLDFCGVTAIEPEYLQLRCSDNESWGRVLDIKNLTWLKVIVDEYKKISDFKEVKLSTFQERPCLEVRSDTKRNPLSIYLIDLGKFFSIPPAPGTSKVPKDHCMIFNRIFPSYALIAFGHSALDSSISFFLIWRFKENDYFSLEGRVDGKVSDFFDNNILFKNDCFTKDHIGTNMRPLGPKTDDFQIISTETWEPIELEFTFTVKSKTFGGAYVDKNVMSAYITGPDLISTNV